MPFFREGLGFFREGSAWRISHFYENGVQLRDVSPITKGNYSVTDRKASSENLESLIKGVGEGVGNILDRASPVKGVANIFGQQESKYLHLTFSKPVSSHKSTRDIWHTHISLSTDFSCLLLVFLAKI